MADANLSASPQSKSIFQTQTFWFAVCTAFVALAPVLGKDIDKLQKREPIMGTDVMEIVGILAATGLTILSRTSANNSEPVYTPRFLPGPNKEDVQPPMSSTPPGL